MNDPAYVESFRFALFLFPMAVALVVLLLAPVAASMFEGKDTIAMLCCRKFWGAYIIVFLVVCLPITAAATSGFAASLDLQVLALSYVPIVVNGLAMQEVANRILRKARDAGE